MPEETYTTYALYNPARDTIYIGQTSDLEKRIATHNTKAAYRKNDFTSKNDGVWELVYSERLPSRAAAMKREKEMKSSRGRASIWDIIKNMRP